MRLYAVVLIGVLVCFIRDDGLQWFLIGVQVVLAGEHLLSRHTQAVRDEAIKSLGAPIKKDEPNEK